MSLFDGAISGTQLDAMKFAPLQWCVDGIIPEGTGVIAGPSKIGKSWMVADIGLACASGGIALGKLPVEKRPVLYLALEDSHRRLQDRFRKLTGGHPIPEGMIVVTDERDATATEWIREFFTTHMNDRPVVFLDTLGKVLQQPKGNSNSYLDEYQQVSQLMELSRIAPGSTLGIVHHTRKSDAVDFVDKISGTTGIVGAADFAIIVSRQRSAKEGRLQVTGRDVEEAEYALSFDNGIWTIDDSGHRRAFESAEESRLGERSQAVLALVRERENAGLTTRPADVSKKLDLDGRRASEMLTRLVDGGFITKSSRGCYGIAETAETAVNAAHEDNLIPLSGNGPAANAENTQGLNPQAPQSDPSYADCRTALEQGLPQIPHKPHRQCPLHPDIQLTASTDKCWQCGLKNPASMLVIGGAETTAANA